MTAYLRKGETYVDLAHGARVGTSTVFDYVHEAIELAELGPTLEQALCSHLPSRHRLAFIAAWPSQPATRRT